MLDYVIDDQSVSRLTKMKLGTAARETISELIKDQDFLRCYGIGQNATKMQRILQHEERNISVTITPTTDALHVRVAVYYKDVLLVSCRYDMKQHVVMRTSSQELQHMIFQKLQQKIYDNKLETVMNW